MIAVVGAGRVGRSLARALRLKGFRVGAVVTTNARSARAAVRFIGAGRPLPRIEKPAGEADIVLVATPDRAVAEAGRALARLPVRWRGKTVLHTSGALSSVELAPLGASGAAVGSCHPIYPFPRSLRQFPRAVVFDVEGERRAVKVATALVRALRGIPIQLDAEGKTLCHAAGTLVAGHLLALVDLGTRGLVRAGVPRRLAWPALQPLASETLRGYQRWGAGAWTGPLERGDVGTVRRHLRALRDLPKAHLEVYLALARASVELYRKPQVAATRELRRLLGMRGRLR
jgi:predicted short-subunit dehydrogenase-like oxidoreductase (DUF2520 family)